MLKKISPKSFFKKMLLILCRPISIFPMHFSNIFFFFHCLEIYDPIRGVHQVFPLSFQLKYYSISVIGTHTVSQKQEKSIFCFLLTVVVSTSENTCISMFFNKFSSNIEKHQQQQLRKIRLWSIGNSYFIINSFIHIWRCISF